MRSKTNRVIYSMLGCSSVLVLSVGLIGIKANGQLTPGAVTTEQVIASIRTAVATNPGNVQEVEVDDEDGMAVVEVEILALDGTTQEVVVDIATNTAISD